MLLTPFAILISNLHVHFLFHGSFMIFLPLMLYIYAHYQNIISKDLATPHLPIYKRLTFFKAEYIDKALQKGGLIILCHVMICN